MRVPHRLRRLPWRTFLAVLGALVVLRLGLAFGLRAWVLHELNGIPDYELELGDLDLNLWRGAYELEDVRLHKEGRPRDEPFFEAARVDLAVSWSALLRGELVNSTVLHRPALRFVVADSERRSQTGIDRSWSERFQALFPLRIDRFAARDGTVRFVRPLDEGAIDVYVDDVYLEARNLTNIRDTTRRLVAEAELAGRPYGTGELEALLVFDPFAEDLRMELDVEVREVALADLNDVLRAYGGFDAEGGRLGLYLEAVAAGGRFEGYVKTLWEDLDVLGLSEADEPDEALEAAWEAVVGGAAEILENQPHDRLATRVPLEGEVGDVGTDLWTVVANLVRNALVEALRPALDHTLGLDDVGGTS